MATQPVPVLDFVGLLREQDPSLTQEDVLQRPYERWKTLSPEKQAAVLARLGVPCAPEWVLGVRLEQGEGTLEDDGIFRLEWRKPRGWPFRKAREALQTPPPLDLAAEPVAPRGVAPAPLLPSPDGSVALPTEAPVFHDASAVVSRRGILALLDRAWGGEPYSIASDGAFFKNTEEPGWTVIDRYVVDDAFASVALLRKNDTNEVVYRVEEPPLTPDEETLIATLNDRLRDVLILDDDANIDRPTYLAERVFEMLPLYKYGLDRRTAYKIAYYFVRNYLGFGRLDALMRDVGIEDVSCNGPNLPIYVVHSRHQNVATDLAFDELELNSFTIKLAQRGGKLLSIAQPMVDATLPDGSRIQASLGREVTSRGSAFTIRKFRADPLTAVDLIRSGTHTLDSMAFLWMMVENKRNLVVMGATASGKTTTLNCLSQFIPPTLKVVTIEDTREITLQHENWLAAVTRDSFSGAASERISMYDLLRAALRQRPEYIIVGEIRGVEGLTLFQAMSTGHTCFSTMHAGSVENAVYRLENAPISVPRVMLSSLDFLLLQGQVDIEGRQTRRMLSLHEVNGIDPSTRNLRFNEVYKWDPVADALTMPTGSSVLDLVRQKRGWSRATLDEEMGKRRAVLEGLVAKKKRNYIEVAKAVRQFYADQGAPAPAPADAVHLQVGNP